MKKANNFYIIGGQYESFCHGACATLLGAKRIATKNAEYWDNWQGWHVPAIYRAEDVIPVNNFYGETFAPKRGALPVASATYNNGDVKWEDSPEQF